MSYIQDHPDNYERPVDVVLHFTLEIGLNVSSVSAEEILKIAGYAYKRLYWIDTANDFLKFIVHCELDAEEGDNYQKKVEEYIDCLQHVTIDTIDQPGEIEL